MSLAAFPAARLRRTRASAWSRALVAENSLTPADLIWPLFVTEGQGVEEPVGSLPGVSRWSLDGIAARAREAVALGIPCLALFPNTPATLRSVAGNEALNRDNLMCRAVKAIRDACGSDIGVLTDVALDPYTSHGQDGLLDASGYVVNDDTVAVLVDQALNQAEAGADIIAPSDMGMPLGHPTTTEVRVELEDIDGGTKMVMTHIGIPADSPGAAGWRMAFDKLAAHIHTHA